MILIAAAVLARWTILEKQSALANRLSTFHDPTWLLARCVVCVLIVPAQQRPRKMETGLITSGALNALGSSVGRFDQPGQRRSR